MKVRIVKEVKRGDGLWRFACGDVLDGFGFGIERIWYRKSIGFGIGKIWYRKKYRTRYRKNLVSEKVSESGFVRNLGIVTHCLTVDLNIGDLDAWSRYMIILKDKWNHLIVDLDIGDLDSWSQYMIILKEKMMTWSPHCRSQYRKPGHHTLCPHPPLQSFPQRCVQLTGVWFLGKWN